MSTESETNAIKVGLRLKGLINPCCGNCRQRKNKFLLGLGGGISCRLTEREVVLQDICVSYEQGMIVTTMIENHAITSKRLADGTSLD